MPCVGRSGVPLFLVAKLRLRDALWEARASSPSGRQRLPSGEAKSKQELAGAPSRSRSFATRHGGGGTPERPRQPVTPRSGATRRGRGTPERPRQGVASSSATSARKGTRARPSGDPAWDAARPKPSPRGYPPRPGSLVFGLAARRQVWTLASSTLRPIPWSDSGVAESSRTKPTRPETRCSRSGSRVRSCSDTRSGSSSGCCSTSRREAQGGTGLPACPPTTRAQGARDACNVIPTQAGTKEPRKRPRNFRPAFGGPLKDPREDRKG